MPQENNFEGLNIAEMGLTNETNTMMMIQSTSVKKVGERLTTTEFVEVDIKGMIENSDEILVFPDGSKYDLDNVKIAIKMFKAMGVKPKTWRDFTWLATKPDFAAFAVCGAYAVLIAPRVEG